MSGNVGKSDEHHFVMAGVAVYETAVYHVMEEMNAVLACHLPDRNIEEYELHANAMLAGRGKWRSVMRDTRITIMKDVLAVLKGPSARNLRAFGMIVEKAAISPDDPVEHAYEQISDRFDKFLRRKYIRNNEQQRGLLIVDKSRYEDTLQALAREYRTGGTRWGNLRNLAEVPLFVDSKASRLIQLADLVAYALWRRYEKNDMEFLTPIVTAFDQDGGIYHGLYHKKGLEGVCDCAACASRRFYS